MPQRRAGQLEDAAEGGGWTAGTVEKRLLLHGLSLSPAERLHWLEEALDELLGWVGLARRAGAVDPERSG